MYSSFSLIFWIFFISNQLFFVYTLDDKLDKSAKSVELKHKLAKSDPVVTEEPKPEEVFANEPISVLGISVPPEFENDTIKEDHHTYYNSTFYSAPELAKQFWVDLDLPSTKGNVHEMLSNSHRQATTIELSFEFPFYGHPLKNITIATGGFLYMGDYLHNWIAATQYIAPLMANFDTSQSDQALIKYADNGTAFTAQWGNVSIQDHTQDGAFSFQATLHKNGDIVFAYKNVPYPVSNISDVRHPVKIGISDAYILERALFFVRRKTIYEYHRIDMLKRNISNNTALYFLALPTCNSYKDCTSCLAADVKMECSWCETLKRCSDGIDRMRQTWISNGCVLNRANTCSPSVPSSTDKTSVVTFPNQVPGIASTDKNTVYSTKTSNSDSSNAFGAGSKPVNSQSQSDNELKGPARFIQAEESIDGSGVSTGAVVTIVVFIVALISIVVWVGYAYKFPQTPSGQFLIKYRPSQWSARSKEDGSIMSNSRHT